MKDRTNTPRSQLKKAARARNPVGATAMPLTYAKCGAAKSAPFAGGLPVPPELAPDIRLMVRSGGHSVSWRASIAPTCCTTQINRHGRAEMSTRKIDGDGATQR